MNRIYENRGFATRMNISCAVIAIAVVFGCFEMIGALRGGSGSNTNLLFGFFFIAGAIYATKQLSDTAMDSVVAFDADKATGQSELTLWRPLSKKVISGPLDRFTDFQFQMRAGRMRTPILTAHHPDYPRPLEFELQPGQPISDELKALAPEAVAAFEKRAG
jgi:hypothetical protein